MALRSYKPNRPIYKERPGADLTGLATHGRCVPVASSNTANLTYGSLIYLDGSGEVVVSGPGTKVLGYVTKVGDSTTGKELPRDGVLKAGRAGWVEFLPTAQFSLWLVEDGDGGNVALDSGFVDITAQSILGFNENTEELQPFVSFQMDSSTASATQGSLSFSFRRSNDVSESLRGSGPGSFILIPVSALTQVL